MDPRLFLALRPPPEVRARLLARMGGIEGARWQDDDQLHLTLVFLGDVPCERAEELVLALEAVRFAPFRVDLRGSGAFARKGRPTSVHALALPSEPLLALQVRIARCCRRAGLDFETRAFLPHVTLARLNAGSGPLAPFCAELGDGPLGSWTCESYALFESHLQPTGSRYEAVRYYRATD